MNTLISIVNHIIGKLLQSKPRNSNEICKNILQMVGNTPLVELNNIKSDYELKCNLCKIVLNYSTLQILKYIFLTINYKMQNANT